MEVGSSKELPIFENVILVSASSADEAWKQAEEFGKASEGDSNGTLTWDGQPALRRFIGVRKVIRTSGASEQLAHGEEVTYSLFVLKSADLLKELAKGDPVEITYYE